MGAAPRPLFFEKKVWHARFSSIPNSHEEKKSKDAFFL
jgi:hypothetical protein